MDTFGTIAPGCSKHTPEEEQMEKTTKEML